MEPGWVRLKMVGKIGDEVELRPEVPERRRGKQAGWKETEVKHSYR